MCDEADLLRFFEVFFHSITTEGDTAQSVIACQLQHQIYAIAIWQTEVANDEIDWVGRGQRESGFNSAGGENVMPLPAEKPSQRVERRLVIFDNEQAISLLIGGRGDRRD